MRLRWPDIPELPAEPHPFYLLPVRELNLGDSGSLAYRKAGSGGIAVLLLHGLWTSAFTFRNLIDPLKDDMSLILPELLGPPMPAPLEQGDCSPARLAELALAICDSLELDRVLLVAHAEAALAGLEIALAHPKRLLGLVAIGCPTRLGALIRLRGWRLGRRGALKWARSGFGQPGRAALDMLDYADPTVVSRQEIRELARGWATLPTATSLARVLAKTLTASYAKDTLGRLEAHMATQQAFPVPLKLVHGDLDRLAPVEQGQRLNRLIPGSELLIAERSSGAVQVEKPQWTARIIAEAAGR